jgi:uncharacterized phiE125 gp8 family phage protein
MALATIADLKAMLDIQHSDADALLTRLVASAEEWFEGQCARAIESATYTDVIDGAGQKALVPSEYPVVSVTSLKVDGEVVPQSTAYGVDGWFISGDVIRFRGTTYRITEGVGNVELVFVAGYATIPPDVTQAVLEMAALMYRERDRVGQQSHNNASGSTVFYYAPPARVVSTVETYRRVG